MKIAVDNFSSFLESWKKEKDKISFKMNLISGKNHGFTGTDTYKIWKGMKSRIKNQKGYIDYGIQVCARWKEKNGFINFARDMGIRPSKEYSLDRIDNDGDYSPDNCRWATSKEQANNKGHKKDKIAV